jgi:K+-sensing histidine kinase KdpD
MAIDGQMPKNSLINLLVNASQYLVKEKESDLKTTIRDGTLIIAVKNESIGIRDTDIGLLLISFSCPQRRAYISNIRNRIRSLHH